MVPGVNAPLLPVEDVGVACVEAALGAAARLHEARTGERLPPGLDRDQVRACLVSERLFRVAGEPTGPGFAPASRFWRTADGWVRTHANFPWHREALLRAVGAADEAGLAAAIATHSAEEVEAAAFAAGGVAAKVRTAAEWRAHPQGAAVAAEPLVARERLGDAAPRCSKTVHTADNEHRKPADLPAPAAGVRVLDLTRVIAGPVCARFLGALGADVLRLDPPERPDFEPGQPADKLLGKRSAILDLAAGPGARRLEALLADADVVLLGYRPGALARFGLDPEALAERHPGRVIMELAAWGHTGPWHERRGFDSIVQAASGIAAIEAGPDGTPGALPCQLLDHGTGYLAAAAVMDALVDQRERGGTHLARLSLARTAHWLLGEGEGRRGVSPSRPPRKETEAASVAHAAWDETGAAFAVALDDEPTIAAVPPPGSLGGAPLRWRVPASRYGAAEPTWA